MVAVRVTPRAGRDEVGTVDEAGALRVRVTAPPADGAANQAVVRLLSQTLGVPKGAVRIASGAAGRHKRLRVEGVGRSALLARWPGLRVQER